MCIHCYLTRTIDVILLSILFGNREGYELAQKDLVMIIIESDLMSEIYPAKVRQIHEANTMSRLRFCALRS